MLLTVRSSIKDMGYPRESILDFFRGIIIFDMIIVHYNDNINFNHFLIISKLIGYSDIAIEGFILLSGYMIGRNYLKRIQEEFKSVSFRILNRIYLLVKVQYFMIFTISLPVYLLINRHNFELHSTALYIFNSLLFLNQVPLLHILPTFIPLFALSIPVMYLMSKGYENITIISSISLFIFGVINPYLFNLGEKTIFPVLLWQVYFVLGIFLGDKLLLSTKNMRKNIKLYSTIAIMIFAFSAMARFGHHISPFFNLLNELGFSRASKFPLNIMGLFYHGSLLALCYCIIFISWDRISKLSHLRNFFTLYGRYTLLAFVIHVYFCYLLKILLIYMGYNNIIIFVLLLANLIFSILLFRYIDLKKSSIVNS